MGTGNKWLLQVTIQAAAQMSPFPTDNMLDLGAIPSLVVDRHPNTCLSGCLVRNSVMSYAIMRIDLADNLPWQKYSTYFYPRFLPVSQLIIPQRTFFKSLLGRKLGECCLNVLVHLNENRGFNFSIFWRKSLFFFFFCEAVWLFFPLTVTSCQ